MVDATSVLGLPAAAAAPALTSFSHPSALLGLRSGISSVWPSLPRGVSTFHKSVGPWTSQHFSLIAGGER